MDIDVSEVNAFAADLGTLGAKATTRTSKALRATASRIERDARAFAPVDTGNLRNSIGTDHLGALSSQVGPTAAYGRFVEEGTSRMAPHAYLGPAFDRALPDFVSALEQIVSEQP